MWWRGERPVRCSLCGARGRSAHGERPEAVCAGCGALERQRSLVRECAELLETGEGRRCLEAGPLNPRVFGEALRARGWRYSSLDRWRTGNPRDPRRVGFVDHECSLTRLVGFADASFALFLAQHVLEEIVEIDAALGEIARTLRPGGLALLEIPFDAAQRGSTLIEPDRFGNVWRFGADLPERVARHFSEVERRDLAEAEYTGTLLVCTR